MNDNAVMAQRGSPIFDKLYKVRPYLSMIINNFNKCYRATNVVAVNKSMIKFKGCIVMKQYNRIKPISRGYKIWVLANKSGYFIDGKIYTKKNSDKVAKDLRGTVVRKLTSQLKGKNHKIFLTIALQAMT